MKVRPRAPKVKLLSALSLLAALSLSVAACGDDEDDGTSDEAASTEDASAVTVEATEYEFTPSATPTAETKEITFDNQGEDFHAMVFAKINEGFTVDEAVKLAGEKGSAELVAEVETPPGQSKTTKIKKPIEPGDYVLLCPISGPEGAHYELGQLEEFAIQ